MDNFRNAFEDGVNLDRIKEEEKQFQKFDKQFRTTNRKSFHSLKKLGTYVFRIAPAHEPQDIPYLPIRYTNLEILVDEYDNNNNKGRKRFSLRYLSEIFVYRVKKICQNTTRSN